MEAGYSCFVCSVCARTFKKKSHLDDHKSKKIDCSKTTTLSLDSLSYESEKSEAINPERKKLQLDQQRERLTMEMKHVEALQKMEGQEVCYQNQKEAAIECVKAFREGKTVVELLAQPGVGKTGCSQKVMFDMAIGKPEDSIDDAYFTDQMAIITGMNDIEWKEQYEKKLLPSLNKNVYHRGKLDRNISKIARSKLTVMDECHVASDINMTLDRVYKAAGILDIEKMHERGRKLLAISATPEHVENDRTKWGDNAAKVVLKPGPDYKGFRVMLDEKRIHTAPRFSSYESVFKCLKNWDTRYQTSIYKRYFPIRLNINKNKEKILTWIKEACVELGWADPIHHDADSKQEDKTIDDIMSVAPHKHTLIIIKAYWTASKRLKYQFVGGTYEEIPVGKRNTTKTSQGLTARFCDNFKYEHVGLKTEDGRDEWENPELRPLHFCDKAAIEEYLNWFEKGADYSKAPYASPKINANGKGRVRAKKSTFHHSNLKGIKAPDEEKSNYKQEGPFTKDIVIKRVQTKFGKTPTDRTFGKLIEGYLVPTFMKAYFKKEVHELTSENRLTEEEFAKIGKSFGLSKSNPFRIYAVCPTKLSSPEELMYYIRYDSRYLINSAAESSTEFRNELVGL
jgi:hypothetical protein